MPTVVINGLNKGACSYTRLKLWGSGSWATCHTGIFPDQKLSGGANIKTSENAQYHFSLFGVAKICVKERSEFANVCMDISMP